MTPSRQQREQLADSLGVASVDDISTRDQWELLGDPAKREALKAKLDVGEAAGGDQGGDLDEWEGLDEADAADLADAVDIMSAPPAVQKPSKSKPAATGWDEDGFFTASQRQMRDPQWCQAHQADIAKASAARTLRILPE